MHERELVYREPGMGTWRDGRQERKGGGGGVEGQSKGEKETRAACAGGMKK